MTIIFLNLTLNVCGLIVMLITLYGVIFEVRQDTIKNRIYRSIVALQLFCILVDLSSYIFVFLDPGGPGWYITSFIAAIPPFLWIVLIMFYAISFIREKKDLSWMHGWIFLAIVVAIIVSGSLYALRGEAFTWEDNHFQPGFMGLVVFFSMLFILLYYGVMIFWHLKYLGIHDSIALFMFLLIPMVFLTADALVPGLYSILFGMAVSVQICYVLVQHHEVNEQMVQLAKQNQIIESSREKLEEAKQAAESASQAKSLFLNNMSHDIRTPMNAILGFTELMERDIDHPEIISQYLQKIKSSGNYLLTLINNVLDIARIESGKAEIDMEFCDLQREQGNIVSLFEEMLRKKNQTFTTHNDIQHQYIMTDKIKMEQILVNLISNAIKYTPEGGHIAVNMIEMPSSVEGRGRYTLTVKDDGIGMSKEFCEHIFENFSREKNTTDSKVIGTGLGMSIVKKLVELLGGTISVESELGVGSTFTIIIDQLIVDDPEKYLLPRKEIDKKAVSFDGRRILLAEDNDLNAEIAMLLLEDEGITVERAVDGIECVKMINDAAPGYYDMILMDIQMPNLNGYEATLRIRQIADPSKANIPIVAITANAFEEDRQQAMAVGMNGHLSKPIEIPKLLEMMAEVM